jgi:hypothetical protein
MTPQDFETYEEFFRATAQHPDSDARSQFDRWISRTWAHPFDDDYPNADDATNAKELLLVWWLATTCTEADVNEAEAHRPEGDM